MKGYYKLRKLIVEMLEHKLPKHLTYHSMGHTLSVLKVCNQYILRENVNSHNAKLLRLGALLHDIGFIVSSDKHEEIGSTIAKELMQAYGFSEKDISTVQGLIIATKIPQSPNTKLEKILCDSDLDYLGRSDFYKISNLLFEELKIKGIVKRKHEWDLIQIQFLKKHVYHTNFALKNRQPKKEARIEELLLQTGE